MAGTIYGLCALTAALCAWLLFRSYQRSGNRLLLWGGLCFAGLTMANGLLIVDKLVLPETDLSVWRHALTLFSLLVLLYGLIWDTE
jgi:heme A synthase